MRISDKAYEALNLVASVIPLLITFLGTVLIAVGVGENTTNIILVILGAVATFLNSLIKELKKNYYKENTITVCAKSDDEEMPTLADEQ